eukprot:366364-Chlamydomonas_euryale.AAC.3
MCLGLEDSFDHEAVLLGSKDHHSHAHMLCLYVAQMAKAYRQKVAAGASTPHRCDLYDIPSAERALLSTNIYNKFKQYPKLMATLGEEAEGIGWGVCARHNSRDCKPFHGLGSKATAGYTAENQLICGYPIANLRNAGSMTRNPMLNPSWGISSQKAALRATLP